jgi:3-hydroxybutyryl-CoA dehydrogenase
MSIERVGVLGCGLTGSGIAQVFAMAGFEATVLEVEQKYLAKGFAGLKSRCRGLPSGPKSVSTCVALGTALGL